MEFSEIHRNGIYRHFKGGIYQVFGLACPESMVVSQQSKSRMTISAKHTESGCDFSVRTILPSGFHPYRYCHNLDSNEILVIYRDAEYVCKDTNWGREAGNFCQVTDGIPRFERLIDYPLVSIIIPPLHLPHQWIVMCGSDGIHQAIAVFGQNHLDKAVAYARMMKTSHKEQDLRVEPVPFLE